MMRTWLSCKTGLALLVMATSLRLVRAQEVTTTTTIASVTTMDTIARVTTMDEATTSPEPELCNPCPDGSFDANLISYDGSISCQDWYAMATAQPANSDQCLLDRVLGVNTCGCSMPSSTPLDSDGNPLQCSLCADGSTDFASAKEFPTAYSNTAMLTCGMLDDLPAVDGPDTCQQIQQLAAEFCECPHRNSTNDAQCSVCPTAVEPSQPDKVFWTTMETCAYAQEYMQYYASIGDSTMCDFYAATNMLDMASFCGCEGSEPPKTCQLCPRNATSSANTTKVVTNPDLAISGTDGLTCGAVQDMIQYVNDDDLCEQLKMVSDDCCAGTEYTSTTNSTTSTAWDQLGPVQDEGEDTVVVAGESLQNGENEVGDRDHYVGEIPVDGVADRDKYLADRPLTTITLAPTDTVAPSTEEPSITADTVEPTNTAAPTTDRAEELTQTVVPTTMNSSSNYCQLCENGGSVQDEFKPLVGTERTCGQVQEIVGTLVAQEGVDCHQIVELFGGRFEFDPTVYCGCPNTEPTGTCDFCPPGQAVVYANKIISDQGQSRSDTNSSGITASASNVTCADYGDLAKASSSAEFCDAVKTVGATNGCCGEPCPFCPDGSNLDETMRSKVFVGGRVTCGDYEDVVLTIPRSDQCPVLFAQPDIMFDVQRYCDCPDLPATGICNLCPEGQVVTDPNFFLDDISITCGHLSDVADATTSNFFCESLQQIGDYYCCGPPPARNRQLRSNPPNEVARTSSSSFKRARTLDEQLRLDKAVRAVKKVAVTMTITPQRPPSI